MSTQTGTDANYLFILWHVTLPPRPIYEPLFYDHPWSVPPPVPEQYGPRPLPACRNPTGGWSGPLCVPSRSESDKDRVQTKKRTRHRWSQRPGERFGRDELDPMVMGGCPESMRLEDFDRLNEDGWPYDDSWR